MRCSQKVLLVLTSAAVIPAIMVTGMQPMKPVQTGSFQDGTVENIASYLKERMPEVPEDELLEIANYVYTESRERDLDYRLVLAIMKVESNFKREAISSKGARGLLQIKPSLGRVIAEDLGVDWSGDRILHEPEKNIKFGVYHLSQLIEDFDTLPWALYAYNSGSTKARERAAQRKQPGLRFARTVLNEYKRTMIVLPDP